MAKLPTDVTAINTRIRSVIEASGLDNPHEVGAEVDAETPDSELRDGYALALVESVRRVFATDRSTALTSASFVSSQPPAKIANSAHSAKLVQRREWTAISRVFESCLCVANNTSRPVGECNAADLDFAVSTPHEDQEREVLRPKTVEKLRDALVKHNVKTVADLPQYVLAPILRSYL